MTEHCDCVYLIISVIIRSFDLIITPILHVKAPLVARVLGRFRTKHVKFKNMVNTHFQGRSQPLVHGGAWSIYSDPAQTFLLTKQKANDPMMG